MPFMRRFAEKTRDEKAFGIIEALMAVTLMTLVLVALLGLLGVSVKAVATNKLSTVATQIANEKIEDIRSQSYDEIEIESTEETRTLFNTDFVVNTEIIWVDDSLDGTSTADADGPNDYKQASVEVSWIEKGITRKVRATTFIRSEPSPTEPPTVNFETGGPDMPSDGTIFGLDEGNPLYNAQYEEWFAAGTVPLKATGEDPDSDLVSMRFYVSGITPPGGLYSFDPIAGYTNLPVCFWDPDTVDDEGDKLWTEGTHEVVVEVWDAQGNRDAKSIFWIIDREAPAWRVDEPANLTASALGLDTIHLTWQKAWDGSDQISRYKVYRKGPGEGSFSVVQADLSAPSATYDDTGLEQEWATYEYYLTALSPGGRESTETTNIALATTWFNITGVSFKKQGKRKVTLSWNPPPVGVTVHHFNIYRNGSMINWAAGTATSFTDDNNGDGLPGRTPFDYKVRAFDNNGVEINQSISLSVTTVS